MNLWYPLRPEAPFLLQLVFSNGTIFHWDHFNFMSAQRGEYQRSTLYANYESSCTGCLGKSNSSRPCATISSVQTLQSSRVEFFSKQRRPSSLAWVVPLFWKCHKLCIFSGRRQTNVLENARCQHSEDRHCSVCELWHYVTRSSTNAGVEVWPITRCGRCPFRQIMSI